MAAGESNVSDAGLHICTMEVVLGRPYTPGLPHPCRVSNIPGGPRPYTPPAKTGGFPGRLATTALAEARVAVGGLHSEPRGTRYQMVSDDPRTTLVLKSRLISKASSSTSAGHALLLGRLPLEVRVFI